jgi:hypothetical protein
VFSQLLERKMAVVHDRFSIETFLTANNGEENDIKDDFIASRRSHSSRFEDGEVSF